MTTLLDTTWTSGKGLQNPLLLSLRAGDSVPSLFECDGDLVEARTPADQRRGL
jgi:hypothetical protein